MVISALLSTTEIHAGVSKNGVMRGEEMGDNTVEITK